MTNKIEEAKKTMEKGWKAREDHKFEEAEKLLKDAKKIFEKEGDWFNVTECLNHLAYNEKLQAIEKLNKGIDYVHEATEVASKHETKDVFIDRAFTSLYETAGIYEKAIEHARKTLNAYGEGCDKADMLSHISSFELRLGNLQKARETNDKAIEMFENHKSGATEPHRYIWETRLLGNTALIEFHLGNRDKAVEIAKNALEIAEKHNLKTRKSQLELLLEIVNS